MAEQRDRRSLVPWWQFWAAELLPLNISLPKKKKKKTVLFKTIVGWLLDDCQMFSSMIIQYKHFTWVPDLWKFFSTPHISLKENSWLRNHVATKKRPRWAVRIWGSSAGLAINLEPQGDCNYASCRRFLDKLFFVSLPSSVQWECWSSSKFCRITWSFSCPLGRGKLWNLFI